MRILLVLPMLVATGCERPPTAPVQARTTATATAGSGPFDVPTSDIGRVFTISDDLTRPQLIKKVEPDYPPSVREPHGTIVFELLVDQDGVVRSASVIQPLGVSVPGLEHTLEQALLQWRYTPALSQGRPVAVLLPVTIEFKNKNH